MLQFILVMTSVNLQNESLFSGLNLFLMCNLQSTGGTLMFSHADLMLSVYV